MAYVSQFPRSLIRGSRHNLSPRRSRSRKLTAVVSPKRGSGELIMREMCERECDRICNEGIVQPSDMPSVFAEACAISLAWLAQYDENMMRSIEEINAVSQV